MSDQGGTGLRARLPDLRQNVLRAAAMALVLVGVVLQTSSAEVGSTTWIWPVAAGVVGTAITWLLSIRTRMSWDSLEERALRRSVVRAVNRGQELRLESDVREDLLYHYRDESPGRWLFGLGGALVCCTLAVLGLVLGWSSSGLGFALVGVALVVLFFEEGRQERRVIDAVQNWPAADR